MSVKLEGERNRCSCMVAAVSGGCVAAAAAAAAAVFCNLFPDVSSLARSRGVTLLCVDLTSARMEENPAVC